MHNASYEEATRRHLVLSARYGFPGLNKTTREIALSEIREAMPLGFYRRYDGQQCELLHLAVEHPNGALVAVYRENETVVVENVFTMVGPCQCLKLGFLAPIRTDGYEGPRYVFQQSAGTTFARAAGGQVEPAHA
ncbi:MAG: hypothetical protein AB199_03325 [Parcubacteria bacterium C7867-004]|nr:MAG: hypothetical protein AB199_03325 [Parcubacteria bacterium C7867-004]